ncbi:MAG: glutamine synthetase family protein [Prevotellaceae bacterium]|jgi:glutamine synthetase|nr:glutamine synthetase family protein [Prevotellaceae bacterium]
MTNTFNLSPNPLVRFLQKEPKEFTKSDLIYYISENNIEIINLRYVGADGRLKTLNFIINDLPHLDSILSYGERVDGSSLFPYIESGASDLYVIPRYRTAFLNPFSQIPSVDILCSYYTKDGKPLETAPEYTLRKAHQTFKRVTGMEFQAMGELEYYIVSKRDELFEAENQRGYHESSPFCKWGDFRRKCMQAIAKTGGKIKYGHSEVGNFTLNDFSFEQNEIEFLPVDVEEAADQLLIAKWILRTLAYEHGLDLTFSPKITTGKAGSGMHVHTKIVKDSRNMYVDGNGELTNTALKTIAGFLDTASSLTAFGNTVPTSYFRLVPHQEAPTNICWGDRNRSVLVRVPLGWTSGAQQMITDANPLEQPQSKADVGNKQTVEFRCPDGSADIYLLMAGLTVAARHGFEKRDAIEYAKERYVSVNIFSDEHKATAEKLSHLPDSCTASAECLEQQRSIYEQYQVFSPQLVDGLIKRLKSFDDSNLRRELENDEEKTLNLVRKYANIG